MIDMLFDLWDDLPLLGRVALALVGVGLVALLAYVAAVVIS